eukprot:g15321.t1
MGRCFCRVTAFVMIPGMQVSDPKSICAQICSEWTEVQTGAAVDTVEQTSMTFDPLARIRGRCRGCQYCQSFILIPCDPWQPDDAPAGTAKANYVIRQALPGRIA